MSRLQPIWQQSGDYDATTDRQLLSALWPSGGATGAAPFASANTMVLNIPAGLCAVPLQGGQGSALCRWDGNETVTIAAAPPSGQSRIDLVVCQVRDNALDGGADNDFIFVDVIGTPSATAPVVPATPANAYVMTRVTVPGAAANLNGATIADVRRSLGFVGNTDPAWIPATLQNGWVLFGGATAPPAYRRINGLVYLRGAVMNGTMAQAAFTLPVGYRPAYQIFFPIRSGTPTPVFGLTTIQGSTTGSPGQVIVNQVGTNAMIAFDGVVFDPDGT